MLTFAAGVAAYTVLAVLVLAVAERLRAPHALAAALVAHGILPRRTVRAVAAVVTAAEVVLAVVLVTGPLPVALTGAALLFVGYGCYGSHVARTGRGGPCGCGGVEVPMDRWVITRAFVLAGLAAAAAVAGVGAGSLPLVPFGPEPLVVLLAAATFGTLLWHLPAAMREPARAEVVS
ncbi:MauE/DoxX family redox-associated membrane protein [Actinophytocola sp.]|uniref:MauE/DoxX family redox-associated membrane protein n=1 Tax=Actinophytocola sp. TaxID=1872138 RepID=UPI003D6B39F7